jgi:hypothetical protein
MNLNIIPFNKAQIYLLFYKPTKDDPFQNRLVAHFDGPFCHVEMAFPERYGEEPWEKVIWGTSIYQGETVFFKQKTYKRDGYVSYAIEVSTTQYHKIKAYCKTQMNNNVPFSKIAMYSAYIPIQLFSTNSTFCSKHVTMALQHGNVDLVAKMNPNLTTPSRLYKYLMSQSPIVQIVPSRMTQSNIIPCCSNLIQDLIMKQKKQESSNV